MRKKLLNNNLTGAISKGGVLYRAGELPTLTTQQKEQAKLVSKLPNDFPFADWEDMTTKQQLRQMQYSGLNAQDQWSLLNSNVPLAVLNEHNQVQGENETRAYAARVAASLVNTTAKAAAAKVQAAVGKPTVSTPLQTTTQQRKLDMKQEEYETRLYEKVAARINDTSKPTNPIKTPTTYKPVDNTQPKDSDEDSGKKNNWVDNLAAIWEDSKRSLFDGLSAFWDSILSPDKDSGLTSTPTRITLETKPPIKTPVITPTPSPKPTPTLTPKPTANLDMISQLVTEQRNQKNPFYLLYSQKEKDRSDCSTQVFDFYSIKGEKNPLLGAAHETCQMYYEFLHIPPKTLTSSGGSVHSTVPRDNAKGTPGVPENWQSITEFGDMVIWMENPKFDSGGRLIVNGVAEEAWHIGLCTGNGNMIDRAQWEENNPNGLEEGLFVRGLDTVKSTYEVIMIISPGDEARLTPNDIYNYLLEH